MVFWEVQDRKIIIMAGGKAFGRKSDLEKLETPIAKPGNGELCHGIGKFGSILPLP